MNVTPSLKLYSAVLFLMAAVACDSSGPGSGGEATPEGGGDSNITAPAGTTGGTGTSDDDGAVTGSDGTTATGGSGSTGGSGTTGDATTGGGSSSGGSGSGGSGSGGSGTTGSITGGVTLNICAEHPEICLGPIEKIPGGVGPSIGLPPGAGPGGWADGPGGLGVEYDPTALQKFRDGMPLSSGVTRFGTTIEPNIVFKDFAQGGSFRSTGEVTVINGVRKTFPAGTTFNVTKDITGIFATLPDGTTENIENTAIFTFRDGAMFTRAASNEAINIERSSAVQFRLGGFDTVQIGNTMKAPAVEQNLPINR